MPLLLVLLFFFSSLGLAKPVKIEWKPMVGAVRYEIRLSQEGAEPVLATVSEPRWKSDLTPGAYSYELRSVDQLKRPGPWSGAKQLIVMPAAPTPISPQPKEKLIAYGDEAVSLIRLKKDSANVSHLVQVFRGDQLILEKETELSEIELKALEPGVYRWRARPVVKSQWRGPSTTDHEFTIERRELTAPEPIAPKGSVELGEKRQVELRWTEVEGAASYAIEVESDGKLEKYISTQPVHPLSVAENQSYSWTVRALANVDRSDKATSQGPQGTSRFEVTGPARVRDRKNKIEIGTAYSPYTYEVFSPRIGLKGSSNSGEAMNVRIQSDFALSPSWTLWTHLSQTTLQIQEMEVDQGTLGLGVHAQLFQSASGWSLGALAGLESREFFQVAPQNPNAPEGSLQRQDFSLLGARVGFDLKSEALERWDLITRAVVFLPAVALRIPSTASLKSTSPFDNAILSFQAVRWLSPKAGVATEASYEKRGLHFTSEPSDEVEKAELQFFSLSLSFLYQW